MKAIVLLILISLSSSYASFMQNANQISCPDQSVDLRPKLTQVRSQGNTQWCTAFSLSTLFEEHLYRHTGEKMPLSVGDLNASRSSFLDPERKRQKLRVGRQVSGTRTIGLDILLGVQHYNEVYPEETLPFTWSGGDLSVRRMLDRFFKGETTLYREDLAGAPYCKVEENRYPISRTFYDFIASFEDESQRTEEGNLEVRRYQIDDRKSVTKKMHAKFLQTLRDPEGERIQIPPFNIETNDDFDVASWIGTLVRGLSDGRPVQTGVCNNRMTSYINPEHPKAGSSDCAPHSVAIVGVRKVDGKCQLLVRNSYGTEWPGADHEPGDGYLWIGAEDLGRVAYVSNRKVMSNYLRDRNPTDPIENREFIAGTERFRGEMSVLYRKGTYHQINYRVIEE